MTIVGGNNQENRLKLSFPHGIRIDNDEIIYIADWAHHRIIEWNCHTNSSRIVAGGNGDGYRMDQLHYPTDVIIDIENNSYIISDMENRRVMQWSRYNNTTNGQVLISNVYCWGLTLDKDGFLYVSDCVKHEVRRWKQGEREGVIVAGGNGAGDQLNQLNFPTFLFVDKDYSLYVSDRDNHRILKWIKGAKEGIVVAGGNAQGGSMKQLSSPLGVIVDHFGQIYVADYGNNRIVRWCEGSEEGSIIVGGNSKGQKPNLFSGVSDLTLDREGNLYVADYSNHRIQKFEINLD